MSTMFSVRLTDRQVEMLERVRAHIAENVPEGVHVSLTECIRMALCVAA